MNRRDAGIAEKMQAYIGPQEIIHDTLPNDIMTNRWPILPEASLYLSHRLCVSAVSYQLAFCRPIHVISAPAGIHIF